MSAPALSLQAMLFLSKAAPVFKPAADGVPQLTLRAVHRIGQHQTEAWTLVLSGPEADYWHQHRVKLQPGTPLNVHAHQLRAHSVAGLAEIVAHVTAMGIVPQPEKATEKAAAKATEKAPA